MEGESTERAARVTVLDGFMASFLPPGADRELIRRVTVLFLVSCIGIANLIVFGAVALAEGTTSLGVLDLLTALALIANIFFLRLTRRHEASILIGLCFAGALFVFAFLTGGSDLSGFVWFYTFPLLASFMLGSRRGTFAGLLVLAPVVVLFALVSDPLSLGLADYGFDFKIRFVPSYLVVLAFSYLFERSREKSIGELGVAHLALEERVKARTAELVSANRELEAEISVRSHAERELSERVGLLALAADVGRAMAGQEDLEAMLKLCTDAFVKHLGAAFARIWTMDDGGRNLVLRASSGMYTHLDGPHSVVPLGSLKIGVIARDGTPILSNRVVGDPHIRDQEWAVREGMRSFAGYPLAMAGRVVGVMGLFSREHLSVSVIDALGAVARQIALGIERKKSEKVIARALSDLERQHEALKKLDRMKDAFIDAVSHELKTPVAKHAMQLEMLRPVFAGLPAGSGAMKAVKVMEESIRRQQSVIRNLLDLTRLESGRRPYRSEEVRLDEVLGEVRREYEYAVESLGVAFAFDVPVLTVRSDREMLWHVFSNLVNNAVKFRRRGVRHEVSVQVGAEGGAVVVCVRDNGIGLEAGERKMIFEKFYQSSASIEGSGVGLTICRTIVEGLGGRIWLESGGREKGTAAFVSLPVDGVPASH